jgi:uncharacterized protein with NRDE domain
VCTLTFAWQVFPDAPLVVAANRDELVDRPSEPPAVRDGDRRFLAPRDAEAGGTWIGVNDAGVFVGITNRWVDADLAGERSRGLLVRDALGCDTAEAAGRLIENAVDDAAYGGFNLVVADAAAALLYEYDGSLSVRGVEPGVHVVVNVGADGRYEVPASRADPAERQVAAVRVLQDRLAPDPGESPTDWRDRAGAALADHDVGVCVHGDGFGTRSSSLLVVGDDEVDYRFADGPPCETAVERVDAAGFGVESG